MTTAIYLKATKIKELNILILVIIIINAVKQTSQKQKFLFAGTRQSQNYFVVLKNFSYSEFGFFKFTQRISILHY